MSRNLPARPNLEFLKKEAKSLLDVLLQRDGAAQPWAPKPRRRRLADAQHALARDYGFASWPKLKAHVESMAVSVLAPPSAEREGGHLFAGRWIANVAQSKRHPANLFQRGSIEFVVNGNTVDIEDEFVDESGRVVRGHNTIVADGVEHPTPNGFVLTAAWRGTTALEFVATKNGEVVGRGEYTVSADGRNLTIQASDQVIVLDRVDTGA
jgi:hypothetical protein